MENLSPDPPVAFTRLFVAAQPALHGFLMSLVHDPHAADDLLQELAERMWRKFGEYDRQRPFVAWGIGFARLLAMEWRAAEHRDHPSFHRSVASGFFQTRQSSRIRPNHP